MPWLFLKGWVRFCVACLRWLFTINRTSLLVWVNGKEGCVRQPVSNLVLSSCCVSERLEQELHADRSDQLWRDQPPSPWDRGARLLHRPRLFRRLVSAQHRMFCICTTLYILYLYNIVRLDLYTVLCLASIQLYLYIEATHTVLLSRDKSVIHVLIILRPILTSSSLVFIQWTITNFA